MIVHVDVERACDDIISVDDASIVRWVQSAAASAENSSVADVAVRIVGRDEIHSLNRDFRQRDKATNVLSFPAGKIEGLPTDERQPLGDIVVCAAIVAAEALEQDKAEADHWAHMLVHGTLHLLGYDHESDVEADAMESLEAQILRDFGIANPYEESLQKT